MIPKLEGLKETPLEQILKHSYKKEMLFYIASHKEDVEQLIELALADQQPYSWRAAWLLSDCMTKNDSRVQKYLNQIIAAIPSKKDGQQRELLKVLLQMNLDEDQEGKVFDECITIWEQIHKTPSVRAFAFKVVLGIAQKHKDLLNEIAFLVQEQYTDSLSQGIRKSILKMIKAISKHV